MVAVALSDLRRPIDAKAAVVALLVSVLWGANPVAIKLGLEDAPPLRLAWMRFVVGGAVVLIWAWATGRLGGLRIARHEVWPLLVIGLIFTAQIATMNVGTNLTSAAHSAILLNLYAVHTVVLSHFMIPGDRLTPARAAGVLVAYAGIVLLFARQSSAGAPTLLGDGIMFVSSLLLAERTVYLAREVRRLDPVILLLSQAIMGCAVFVAGSALFETRPTQWTAQLAAVLVFQGAVVAGFNFIVNLWLLTHYRPGALATFFLTQPIFGVVIANLVTGDPLTVDLLVASLAVALGIGLTTR
jgi:drug/metabolite transporter (DMT)-like permease